MLNTITETSTVKCQVSCVVCQGTCEFNAASLMEELADEGWKSRVYVGSTDDPVCPSCVKNIEGIHVRYGNEEYKAYHITSGVLEYGGVFDGNLHSFLEKHYGTGSFTMDLSQFIGTPPVWIIKFGPRDFQVFDPQQFEDAVTILED